MLVGLFCYQNFVAGIRDYNSTLEHSNVSISSNVDTNRFCSSMRWKRIENRTLEKRCCKLAYKDFSKYWYQGGYYLTDFLAILKTWKCPEYINECSNPLFNYNDFTKAVYTQSCSCNTFRGDCYPTLCNLLQKRFPDYKCPSNISHSSWMEMKNNLTTTLFIPPIPACVQVAMYDNANSVDLGKYHELATVFLPFCGVVWCGISISAVGQQAMSFWTCMDGRAKASVLVVMFVLVVLSIVITLTNGCVVAVFLRNKKLQNSQGIYKLSLSTADFIIGLIVLPSFAISMYQIATRSRNSNSTYDGGRNHSSTYSKYIIRTGLGRFEDTFDYPYVQAVGFFTTLSLAASVYSLTLASLDRLAVVRRPFSYNMDDAKAFSVKAVALMWIFAVIFSLLPFFVGTLRFGFVASIMMASAGPLAMYLYIAALLVPLLVMWAATIATCYYTFRHARDRVSEDFAMEKGLARTLVTMVGVFTASLLPSVLALLGSIFLTGIRYGSPGALDQTLATAFISYEFVAVMILVCNSSWNFIIYNARNQSFKDGTKQLFFDIRRGVQGESSHTSQSTI
ncbi:unnamed protein product [Clavelina lepadiformis]|uniref:G-protein coupled receptors family 1 profile domain-containing protein n=1 Tax=Clavelina lepadiformis TaxID=159417 RepID=A0ABP0F0Y6_CLALP